METTDYTSDFILEIVNHLLDLDIDTALLADAIQAEANYLSGNTTG